MKKTALPVAADVMLRMVKAGSEFVGAWKYQNSHSAYLSLNRREGYYLLTVSKGSVELKFVDLVNIVNDLMPDCEAAAKIPKVQEFARVQVVHLHLYPAQPIPAEPPRENTGVENTPTALIQPQ